MSRNLPPQGPPLVSRTVATSVALGLVAGCAVTPDVVPPQVVPPLEPVVSPTRDPIASPSPDADAVGTTADGEGEAVAKETPPETPTPRRTAPLQVDPAPTKVPQPPQVPPQVRAVPPQVARPPQIRRIPPQVAPPPQLHRSPPQVEEPLPMPCDLDRAVVTVTVESEDGAPLAGAAVELHIAGDRYRTVTLADGRVNLGSLPCGRANVRATLDGYESAGADVTVRNRPTSLVLTLRSR